jgi:glutamate racemase
LKRVINDVVKGVKLIDSAIETSREIKTILEALDLKNEEKGVQSREFYVTDSPERFLKVGEQFLGQKIEHIEKIVLGG